MFIISTRNFPPDIGGIQNLMEGLANSLLEHGPVKVFADKFDSSEIYDDHSRLDIHRVSGFKIFRKYRKANLIKEYLQNNQVRAMFFDHWKSIENMSQDHLKKSCSFCLIHSKEINHQTGSLLNKRMVNSLHKANFIIANSNFTKNLAIKLGVNENKIKIINPGCNYPISIENKYTDKARELFRNAFPKIITIARLDKRKSHQNILMTIKNLKIKFPRIKYISIGDGEEMSSLNKLRSELGIVTDTIMLDKAEEQLKAALLNECDLFLMPSVEFKKSVEGFGISFIEAAAYGKASIGGSSGGQPDAVINGKTGYLCDGNDLNEIYHSIIKIFDNENFKIMGKNALEFSKKFKWKKIIKQYLNLI